MMTDSLASLWLICVDSTSCHVCLHASQQHSDCRGSSSLDSAAVFSHFDENFMTLERITLPPASQRLAKDPELCVTRRRLQLESLSNDSFMNGSNTLRLCLLRGCRTLQVDKSDINPSRFNQATPEGLFVSASNMADIYLSLWF